MPEIYIVGELKSSEEITITGWSDAMDWVEEYCGQFDEEIFMGIWLKESGELFAVYNGQDWYTK